MVNLVKEILKIRFGAQPIKIRNWELDDPEMIKSGDNRLI